MDDDLPPPLGAWSRRRWSAAGVTADELRDGLGRRVHHGRWAWAAADPSDPLARALADASVPPPCGALGGWGAAQVLGVGWLDGTTAAGGALDGVVCVPPAVRVRRTGLVALRARLDPGDVVRVRPFDVRVTSPVRTAFDLARTAPDLATAVERLDCVLHHGVRVEDVAAYAAARPGWRGVGRAPAALDLASARVRSPAESRLRMVWHAAGLPRPLVNAAVQDSRGSVVAEVDLLDEATGLVGEYDGAPHSGAVRRAKDAARQERLERFGLTVVRVTSADLLTAEPRLLDGAGRARRLTDRMAARGLTPRWDAAELGVPRGGLRRHLVEPTQDGHS